MDLNQINAIVSASLPFAVAGSVVAWPSPILPKMLAQEAPISMNIREIAWMVSLLYLGNLTSPIPAEYLADSYGRRKILLYTGLVSVMSWLMILFATNSTHLFVARFLAGLQFGMIATVQPIYIGEISQPDIRGTLNTFNNFMFGTGSLFSFVVGPFVSYYTFALVSLVFPLLFLLTFLFMPESPYYSLMKNRTENARESLFWLRGDLNRIELESELNQIERTVQNQMQRPGSFGDLFATKSARKAMVINIAFSIIKRLTGAGAIMTFGSVSLPHRTFGVINSDECMIILGIVNVLSSFLVAFVADMFSQKHLLIVSCSGCCVTTLVLSVWFFMDPNYDLDVSQSEFSPLLIFLVHNLFYNLACGYAGAVFQADIFPGNVKMKSTAVTTISLAFSSFIINKFYLVIAHYEGVFFNYVIFTVGSFLGVLFFVLYLPETRGKTLEEIQIMLGGSVGANVTSLPQTRTF
ncbi:hypothetical protein J6590_052949 [Homalodisca vitripennis]|nr:hypothetical protein J6590_052949 [Homalodisca vitripennis]